MLALGLGTVQWLIWEDYLVSSRGLTIFLARKQMVIPITMLSDADKNFGSLAKKCNFADVKNGTNSEQELLEEELRVLTFIGMQR